MKKCKKCGKKPAVINYCNDCAREISRMYDDPMLQVRSARAIIDATHPHDSPQRDQMVMQAFMRTFHPEMNNDRVAKMAVESTEEKFWG